MVNHIFETCQQKGSINPIFYQGIDLREAFIREKR